MRRPAFLLILLAVLTGCGGGAPPRPAPSGPARIPAWVGFELRRGAAPREVVRIGLRGALVGPAGGRQTWRLFADTRLAGDAWYFLNTYKPFKRVRSSGDLVFRGHGKEPAGEVEQRMIEEWTRRVAAEAGGSRVGSAYGLVLAWHQGGSAGLCEDAVVDLTGEAAATACGWDREARGRLEPAQLGRVYAWFDRLQPFQTTGGQAEDPRPGTLETRLIFAGRGRVPATAAERAEIQAFAAALFAELAGNRRGSGAAGAEAGTVVPPQRLLLPAATLSPRRAEVALDLPEKAPPLPRPWAAPRPREIPAAGSGPGGEAPVEATPPNGVSGR